MLPSKLFKLEQRSAVLWRKLCLARVSMQYGQRPLRKVSIRKIAGVRGAVEKAIDDWWIELGSLTT